MRRSLLLLPLLLAACAPKEAQEGAKTQAEPRFQVRTLVVQAGTLEREVRYAATLGPERQSRVAAGVAGRVQWTLDPGRNVAPGEVVVQLDPEPFRQSLDQARLALKQAQANLERTETQLRESQKALKAQLEAAQLQLEAAQRRLEEGQRLLALGALAPLDLKALEAQYEGARATYENAREALARVQREDELRLLRLQVEAAQVQVAQAERALREASIRAPFGGEVVEVYVRPGEFIGAGSPAFLLGTESLVAKLLLPPEEAARIPLDARFTLRQNGLEAPARLLRRTELPGQSRLVEVVLRPEAPLAPGPAEARYRLPLAQGVILPLSALATEGGETWVFLAREGRAQKARVRLLAQEGERAAVEGIEPGEKVIAPIPTGLRDGDPIEEAP